MELGSVVAVLKNMASPCLAGSWDNVGLLVEPSPPHAVHTLMLVNDLTPDVLQRAVQESVDMVVSYHPPIFAPLKRVTQAEWKERLVCVCLENRIAVYSPHTSWDAMAQGVNDWLISAFDVTDVRPVEQREETSKGCNKKLIFFMSQEEAHRLSSLPSLRQNPAIRLSMQTQCEAGGDRESTTRVSLHTPSSSLSSIMADIEEKAITIDYIECCDLAKMPVLGVGMGRQAKLKSPITLEAAVAAVKSHLDLKHVRLAKAAGERQVESVAVCAGSGSSVLRGVKADLVVTGEMSHHEVLHAVCTGTSVILTEHSNSERGFLKLVQQRLAPELGSQVKIVLCDLDRDPLDVV